MRVNSKILKMVSVAMFSIIACVPALGQDKPEFKLYPFPTKDSVVIMITGIPSGGSDGFVLYRAEEGSGDFTKLTEKPVTALRDMEMAADAVGESLLLDLFAALGVKSLDGFYEEYQESPTVINMVSLFSLEMNSLLGRLYRDTTVTPGATYSYKADIVDSNGKAIKSIGPVNMAVVAPVIQTPEGFALESKDGAVTLTWNKPGEDFAGIGWHVYRSESKDGPFEKITRSVVSKLGEPKYPDFSLENDKTYYYYVVACDLPGNESGPTEILEATPRDMTPPLPPQELKLKVLDSDEGKQILLTWNMNLETDMAGYNVWRDYEQESENYTKLNEKLVDLEITEYTDKDIEEGTVYYYHITAVDTNDNESKPSANVNIQPPDKTPPTSPIAVEAAVKDKGIVIKWGQNKEKDLFGYHVYRGSKADDLKQITSSVVNAKAELEFMDFGVVSGEKYYYAVMAVDNSMNESIKSDVIEITAPDFIPPEPPANLFAQMGDRQVSIRWPFNQESDIAGYKVYRVEGALEDGEPATGTYKMIAGEISSATNTYQDNDVENGHFYWYRASAYDLAGNEGRMSDSSGALPRDYVAPAAPADVAGEAAEKDISVTWAAGTEDDLAGYKVMRSGMKTAVYEVISGEKLLAPNVTKFTDISVEEKQEYWYKIMAMDTSGNESERSMAAGPLALPVEEEAVTPGAEPEPGEQQKEESVPGDNRE